jgi:iron complex transport system substrate-binding protein
MKTSITHLLAILLATSLFFGCNRPTNTSDNNHQTVTYTDDYGSMVKIPIHPQRIVSTSPAVTAIIFALGGSDLLVGRTDFCVYPPEAAQITSIGGISNLNIERIVSLNPDLVISGSMIPKKSTVQMEKMGVPTVCVIEQQRYEGLYDNISKIGSLIGRTKAADSLNALLRDRLKRLNVQTTAQPKSVYYVVGFGASVNFTAGGDSFINDIIRLAGGRNIAEDNSGWSYSLEKLMQQNPDYIVIRKEDSTSFCRMAPYNNLDAVKNGRVIAIESSLIDLQVPRNTEAIQFLFDRLH